MLSDKNHLKMIRGKIMIDKLKKLLILIIPVTLILIVVFALTGTHKDVKQVKIAVMGNKDSFYPEFELGIEQAVEDLNREYRDTGFSFIYEIYDDNNSFETGASIIDRLDKDDSVTAVIAPNNKELHRLAAYVFDNKKLFLSPYSLYDSIYTVNYYNTVFSLTYSKKKIGMIMRGAAATTPATRWVACIDDSELSMAELHGFIGKSPDDNISLVDCVSFDSITEDMDLHFNRWNILGVDGIMLLSEKERFDEFKLIKKQFPDAQFILNQAFDNSERIENDNELMSLMANAIQSVDYTSYPRSEEDTIKFKALKDTFQEKHGMTFDLWYLHAYNMISMIGDTAVCAGNTDPIRISEMLHADGYDGVCEHYRFNENGIRIDHMADYSIYSDRGTVYMKSLDKK